MFAKYLEQHEPRESYPPPHPQSFDSFHAMLTEKVQQVAGVPTNATMLELVVMVDRDELRSCLAAAMEAYQKGDIEAGWYLLAFAALKVGYSDGRLNGEYLKANQAFASNERAASAAKTSSETGRRNRESLNALADSVLVKMPVAGWGSKEKFDQTVREAHAETNCRLKLTHSRLNEFERMAKIKPTLRGLK